MKKVIISISIVAMGLLSSLFLTGLSASVLSKNIEALADVKPKYNDCYVLIYPDSNQGGTFGVHQICNIGTSGDSLYECGPFVYGYGVNAQVCERVD